jgi:hypothetical protein
MILQSDRTASVFPDRWTGDEREQWIAEYNAGLPVQLPVAEHDAGECGWCDVLRELMAEAHRRADA